MHPARHAEPRLLPLTQPRQGCPGLRFLPEAVPPITGASTLGIHHLRVARALHHDRLVLRSAGRLRCVLALALGGGVASGCFYSEVINERPSGDIERVGSGVPFRGDTLTFRALMDDPDRNPTSASWRFEACNANDICAADETGNDTTFTVTIPPLVESMPTTHVIITLAVEDSYGAEARPVQRLELDVANNAPMIDADPRGREIDDMFPPDVPITISAVASDEDGDDITLSWELFPASGAVPGQYSFTPLPDPPAGGEEYRLLPDVDGTWTVRITASDGLDDFTYVLPIIVVPDQPPCLGALDPAPPPAGLSLLLDAPRRIAVTVVEDDLDIYPPPPADDPFLGAAELRWYLRAPGATSFALVDTNVGGVELDPAHYNPGDRLDVRVEIDDRVNRTVQCAENVPTCSFGQDDACLQRQTWSVEVR